MAVLIGPKIITMSGASLGDQYLTPGNTLLRMIQALVQPNVISKTLTAPPGSPNNGDTYIIGSGGTGAWSGKDNQIAYWTTQNLGTAAWDFWAPINGWLAFNQADSTLYRFNGSTWVAANSSFTATTMIGDGQLSSVAVNNSGGNFSPQALVVGITRFSISVDLSFDTISYQARHLSAGDGTFSVGFYSISGNLIASFGPFTVPNTGGFVNYTNSVTATRLPAGDYFLASADSQNQGSGVAGITMGLSGVPTFYNASGTVYFGTAANAAGAGPILPATLGAISAYGGGNNFDTPAILFTHT